MSTAVADPLVSRAHAKPLAIVVAEAGHPGLAGSQLARVLGPTHGTVELCDVEAVAAEGREGIVLDAGADLAAGLAALRRIRKDAPATRVVLVAPDDSTTAARQALHAGADAYVPARDVARSLAPALFAVMADLVCVPRASRRAIAKPTFSHREKQVLALLVEGMTNRQIAARLYLAESTIKTHVAAAFSKLGVRSRKEAAMVLLDPAEGLMRTAFPPDVPDGSRTARDPLIVRGRAT